MPLAAVGSVGRTGSKCCRFGQGESTGRLRAGRLHSPVTALLTNCGDGPNPTRKKAALRTFRVNLTLARLTLNAPFHAKINTASLANGEPRPSECQTRMPKCGPSPKILRFSCHISRAFALGTLAGHEQWVQPRQLNYTGHAFMAPA
jgi:hypothetical protein